MFLIDNNTMYYTTMGGELDKYLVKKNKTPGHWCWGSSAGALKSVGYLFIVIIPRVSIRVTWYFMSIDKKKIAMECWKYK